MLRLQKTTLLIYIICCVVLPLTVAIRSLVSDPASDGGVLTAGVGQQISLTCSHVDTGGVTVWKFGDPIDCTRGFLHLGAGSQQECGPFSFINISQTNMAPYTSTAVATATSSMTGVVVQCLDGSGGSIVGNATLCIVDNPPSPTNLQCQPMSGRMVVISWSPVPQDCTMSSVYYRINITGNITEEILINTTDTSGQFSFNTTQDYVATITAVMNDPTMRVSEGTSCTFTAVKEVVTTLITTDSVAPTTSHTTISTTEQRTRADSGTCTDTTTAVVITFVITTVLMLIVGVVFGSLATFLIIKKRKSTPEHHSPTDGASGGPFYEQVSPSNATSKEEVEMDKNVAYGHVQQRC